METVGALGAVRARGLGFTALAIGPKRATISCSTAAASMSPTTTTAMRSGRYQSS